MPALAVPTVEFSLGSSGAGNWSYNGDGTIKFSQIVEVDRGLGNNHDALAGAWVYIPDLHISGIPGGPYTATPVTNTISIKSPGGDITYLSGTLGAGDLYPIGTQALGYTDFQIDITNVIVNNIIDSEALAAIAATAEPALDFVMSFQGAPSNGFKWMLDNHKSGIGCFSGAIDLIPQYEVPEPATICLLAIGSLGLIGRKK
jgi:hypothetical protein